jgi:hypothetical protein
MVGVAYAREFGSLIAETFYPASEYSERVRYLLFILSYLTKKKKKNRLIFTPSLLQYLPFTFLILH